MASGNEIVSIHDKSNQTVRPVESKQKLTTSVLTWLRTKACMAGTAGLSVIAKPATGPVLMVCVCLAAIAYNKKVHAAPKPVKKHLTVQHRSVSIAALHGGKMALERLLDAQEARIDKASLGRAVDEMMKLLSAQPISFRDLQRAAAKLEMSGREDEAIKMLTEAHVKALKNKHSLEAYELEMILVEMLIYKGAHDKALQCKCLQESSISDARIPLYKAIIYTLKADKTCAKKYYEEFKMMRGRFLAPDETEEESALFKIVLQFEEFERVVEHLKKEIEHAHKIRAN